VCTFKQKRSKMREKKIICLCIFKSACASHHVVGNEVVVDGYAVVPGYLPGRLVGGGRGQLKYPAHQALPLQAGHLRPPSEHMERSTIIKGTVSREYLIQNCTLEVPDSESRLRHFFRIQILYGLRKFSCIKQSRHNPCTINLNSTIIKSLSEARNPLLELCNNIQNIIFLNRFYWVKFF
jgi:hypothetical protein